MMGILVTGATGQLGFDVMRELQARGMEAKGVGLEDFSLTDYPAMRRFVEAYRPEAIVHCAAYTAVDKAEEEEELCFSVNAAATGELARAAKEVGAKFLYISTDYVFPGTGEGFYEPDDKKGPLNIYGRSKLLGEQAAERALAELFIVRISWVFGKNGKNFIKTMLRLAETHEELSVVGDQIGSPTYTKDLARLLVDLLGTEKYGVYHATNEGVCSWAELAAEAIRLAGKKTRVKAIRTEEYPTPAVRPRNSRLSKDCLDAAGFSRLPPWQDAVRRYLDELD